MIFKSRQFNFDPEPWACYGIFTKDNGKTFQRLEKDRHAEEHEGDVHYEPRPEFEPTRDPEPWLYQGVLRVKTPSRLSEHYIWAPRREQFDTPVNRVLVEFRDSVFTTPQESAIFWAEDWLSDEDERWTLDEIKHARKVLTRLANFAA